MIVVSNSSPLITLSRAGQLELLHELYEQVLVPLEVFEEVTVAGAGLPGAEEIRSAAWVEVRRVSGDLAERVKAACIGLGKGERSAIYLAAGIDAQLVLIDETRARRAAKRLGLVVAGAVAILERGASLGKIADLRSVYLTLIEQGIYFHRSLLDDSLARFGLPKI